MSLAAWIQLCYARVITTFTLMNILPQLPWERVMVVACHVTPYWWNRILSSLGREEVWHTESGVLHSEYCSIFSNNVFLVLSSGKREKENDVIAWVIVTVTMVITVDDQAPKSCVCPSRCRVF